MKYRSTLGGFAGLSFKQALFSPGFLSDGGLIIPEQIPYINHETLKQWSELNYVDLLCEIVNFYVDDDEITRADLKGLIKEALSTFAHPDVVPVKHLVDGTVVLEMFHGPTWAFKDLALSCVGRFMQYFLEKNKSHVTLLVGTSGDTGSAVLEAVRHLTGSLDCIVVLPRGRVSQVQELQMTTIVSDNVHVYRADGTSDDIDIPIKKLSIDGDFVKKHNVISVNSINWARIMVQIAHHFYAYFKVCEKVGAPVEIVVPTGAMGNIIAGVFARKMGLPAQFVAAVTENDVIYHMINTGDCTINGAVVDTLATAMNITNPYNSQRLVSLCSDGHLELVVDFVRKLDSENSAKLSGPVLKEIQSIMRCFRGGDDVIRQTIRDCYHDNQYILCPHTALAVAYHKQQQKSGNDGRRICLATASPLKFPQAMTSSGVPVPENDDVKRLLAKPTRYTDMEKDTDWTAVLRNKIEEISRKVDQKITAPLR